MLASTGTTRRVAVRSIACMGAGDRADFDEVVAVDAVNHEASIEPPSCRVPGPAGFHATALWLRAAFADLEHRFEQSHWLRVADGLVTEHWAVRDDLGQGSQLGWVPPSPAYLLRCALAKRRAARAR